MILLMVGIHNIILTNLSAEPHKCRCNSLVDRCRVQREACCYALYYDRHGSTGPAFSSMNLDNHYSPDLIYDLSTVYERRQRDSLRSPIHVL